MQTIRERSPFQAQNSKNIDLKSAYSPATMRSKFTNFDVQQRKNNELITLIVYGINSPYPLQTQFLTETKAEQEKIKQQMKKYEILRSQVESEFKMIVERREDMFFDSSRNKGFVTILENDIKKNYFEIQYSMKQDADKALQMNQKYYCEGDIAFIIGVKLKQEKNTKFVMREQKYIEPLKARKRNKFEYNDYNYRYYGDLHQDRPMNLFQRLFYSYASIVSKFIFTN